jgi:hypothetical protein
VKADAVIFQGGQNEGPTVGGTFELVAANDVSLYQVKLPATHVDLPGKAPAK